RHAEQLDADSAGKQLSDAASLPLWRHACLEGQDALLELRGGSELSQLAVLGDADHAAFFGYDHDQGIATLGEAQRSRMARPEAFVPAELGRKREVDGETRGQAVFDHQRAVVPSGARVEDAEQQGFADAAVERDTAGDMAGERLAPPE